MWSILDFHSNQPNFVEHVKRKNENKKTNESFFSNNAKKTKKISNASTNSGIMKSSDSLLLCVEESRHHDKPEMPNESSSGPSWGWKEHGSVVFTML